MGDNEATYDRPKGFLIFLGLPKPLNDCCYFKNPNSSITFSWIYKIYLYLCLDKFPHVIMSIRHCAVVEWGIITTTDRRPRIAKITSLRVRSLRAGHAPNIWQIIDEISIGRLSLSVVINMITCWFFLARMWVKVTFNFILENKNVFKSVDVNVM